MYDPWPSSVSCVQIKRLAVVNKEPLLASALASRDKRNMEMANIVVTILIGVLGVTSVLSETLDCTGRHRYSARGTAYYPADDPIEGGFFDMRGHPLKTLQDFLNHRSTYVTVAMDNHAGIAYDTKVCIPELNHKYNRVIDFRVRDTGSAFAHKGYGRIDICTATRLDSYDDTINGHLTLVFH